MASAERNSLDLLRLIAAALVLYSHQYALLGLDEPSFFGSKSFGSAGVTIFFFLSGVLVWASWARDPDFKRFFQRRSLRIFPALWVIVFLSVFIFGPMLTTLPLVEYFHSSDTWKYLTTSVLLPRYVLPGVFDSNLFPHVFNGSLWTLPVEFFCYFTVVAVGRVWQSRRSAVPALALIAAVLLATCAPLFVGARFSPHFEMLAIFWWGAIYGFCSASTWGEILSSKLLIACIGTGLLLFVLLDPVGTERMAVLLFAATSVALAQSTGLGAKLTDKLGDLSYGIYIYAFPVQQAVVHWHGNSGRSFLEVFFWSVLITFVLAYLSWHLIEYQVLRLKPLAKVFV